MAYAIIEMAGTQLWVEPGRFYDINLLHVQPDEDVTIDKVLLVNNDGTVQIGQPYVEGATVEGTVMRHMRGRKIIVYKMRPKKKTRKKQGHRQELTRLMINTITVNGVAIAEDDTLSVTAAPITHEAEPSVEVVADAVAEELAIAPVTETVEVVADVVADDDAAGEAVAETADAANE